MKNFFIFFSLFILTACSTLSIPEYVPDEHPYQRKYYATYERAVTVTKQALEQFGWKVVKEVDPSVYERVYMDITDRILLIAAPRRSAYGVGSHQMRLNVRLLAGKSNTTDVEIRYLSLNKVAFKQLRGYREDGVVEPILKRIEEIIK